MPTSTVLFKTSRTQAVRLPKDVAFPDCVHEVEIIKVGGSRVISPVGQRWDFYLTIAHLRRFPDGSRPRDVRGSRPVLMLRYRGVWQGPGFDG